MDIDTTDFYNDRFGVSENTNYMEDIGQTPLNTYDENDCFLTQSPRTKNYLARKTAGVQVIIIKINNHSYFFSKLTCLLYL